MALVCEVHVHDHNTLLVYRTCVLIEPDVTAQPRGWPVLIAKDSFGRGRTRRVTQPRALNPERPPFSRRPI